MSTASQLSPRIATLVVIALCMFVFANVARADYLDFVGGTWNHGSGDVVGWQPPASLSTMPYSGTTTVAGVTATVTFSNSGTATQTNPSSAGHLQTTTTTGGSGLSLNQSAGAAFNQVNQPLQNFTRIDLAFSAPVEVSLFFHGIDLGNSGGASWEDALYAESFAAGFGAVGTGTIADYALGSNVRTRVLHDQDLTVITPRTGAANPSLDPVAEPTTLTPSSAEVSTAAPVQFFSVYYWNRRAAADFDDNQQLLMTAFDITPVSIPEPAGWMLLGGIGCLALARGVVRAVCRRSGTLRAGRSFVGVRPHSLQA